jgi:WD40 repeat protein
MKSLFSLICFLFLSFSLSLPTYAMKGNERKRKEPENSIQKGKEKDSEKPEEESPLKKRTKADFEEPTDESISLPPELWDQILSYSDVLSLTRLKKVNSLLRFLATDHLHSHKIENLCEKFELTGPISDFSFSPDETKILVMHADKKGLSIYDTQSSNNLKTFNIMNFGKKPKDAIEDPHFGLAFFSSDGRQLIIIRHDVFYRDLSDSQELSTYYSYDIESGNLSEINRTVPENYPFRALSKVGDMQIRWDNNKVLISHLLTNQPPLVLEHGEFKYASFSPSGRFLVSLKKNGSFKLWRLKVFKSWE